MDERNNKAKDAVMNRVACTSPTIINPKSSESSLSKANSSKSCIEMAYERDLAIVYP